MRSLPIALVIVSGLALIVSGPGVSAQEPVAIPPQQPAPKTQLVLTLRGAQRSLTDTVKSVLLEHDNKQWDLVITGSKGRSQFTCELRSADRAALFDIHRAIVYAPEIVVTCANGTPSGRGGVLINLDDPSGGSFVLDVRKP